jgi:hypothetical protein
MQAAFNIPMVIEQPAENNPAANSPSVIRFGNCFKAMLLIKKVNICTTKATAPQIAQSSNDNE